jgi:hypothetical protein
MDLLSTKWLVTIQRVLNWLNRNFSLNIPKSKSAFENAPETTRHPLCKNGEIKRTKKVAIKREIFTLSHPDSLNLNKEPHSPNWQLRLVVLWQSAHTTST